MNKTVTSRFVLKGDNQIGGAFSKAQKQMGDLAKKTALMGAAAITAGAAIVRAQAQNIDQLAKTADALDITTESLQTMQTMAQLSGVDDLDKKLAKLQKNLGEIARRGGTMAESLADVGLNIKDVIALPADQQFEQVAQALSKLENQTLRVSIANDLFGRDAGKLLKMTDDLAVNGYGKMRTELEQMGVLITRTQAAGVERMNDSMTMAQKVATGLAQRFTASLAPAIAAIAEEFVDSAKQSGGFGKEVNAAAESTAKKLFFVLDVIDSVGRTFSIAARLGIIGFEGLKGAVVGVAEKIVNGPNRAVNSLIQMLDAIPGVDIDFRFDALAPSLTQDLILSESIIKQAWADITDIFAAPLPSTDLEKRLLKIRADLAAFKNESKSGETGGIDNGVVPLTEEQRKLNALVAEYQSIWKSTRTDVENHREMVTRIDELYIAGVIPSAEAYADILDRINDRWEASKDKSKDAEDQMTQFAMQGARNMQTQFADFLFDPMDKGFKGMAAGFAQTLRRMAAEAAASAIFNAIFSAMGNSSNSFFAGIGKAFTSRDSGGPGQANTPYLIGRGAQPELFVPNTAGRFIPNFTGQGGGSTNNVTVNIDARETDNPGRLLALVPVIQRQVENSIFIKQRRGYT